MPNFMKAGLLLFEIPLRRHVNERTNERTDELNKDDGQPRRINFVDVPNDVTTKKPNLQTGPRSLKFFVLSPKVYPSKIFAEIRPQLLRNPAHWEKPAAQLSLRKQCGGCAFRFSPVTVHNVQYTPPTPTRLNCRN